jgi:PAS domain S-box-containing protein
MDKDLKNFLVSESLEGIVVTDTHGTILDCNGTACRILGYVEGDLKGEYIGVLFPPVSTIHLLSNLMSIAAREGGFEGEIMLEDVGGDPVMVRLYANGYPVQNPRYILLRFLDWRETQEIMRQLRESSQMAVLGNLTRSMAHEILNPISVVGAYTRRLLRSQSGDSKNLEWARQVISSVEKLESMIELVQTYLNLPPPRFSHCSPKEILDQAVESSRKEAQSCGIRILEEGTRALPKIYMDSVLLEKALSAVLHNSIQRMPKGGDLKVTRKSENGCICFLIEDSGPSLDTRQLEEDLSPIHVVSADSSQMNLAIARRIVDEHSGRFSLGSSATGGVKVEIRLPIDRRALARHRVL